MKKQRLYILILLALFFFVGVVSATTLTLSVRDDIDNTPVAGASIAVNGANMGLTQSDGSFVLDHSESAPLHMSIKKIGYRSWQELVSETLTYLVADLSRESEILTVTVYDSDTLNPITGALVKVSGTDIDYSDSTGASGTVSFDLPSGAIYTLTISAPSYEELLKSVNLESASKNVEYRLIRSDIFLFKVTEAETGDALADALILIDGYEVGITDENGRFSTFLEPYRSYLFEIEADEYVSFTEEQYVSADDLVYDVLLSKSLYPVSISVYNDEKIPVEGASVAIDGSSYGETDPYGRCSITNLVTGNHTIEVRHPGFTTDTTTVFIEDSGQNIAISLKYASAETTIRVQDEEGAAIPGASVFVDGQSIGTTNINGVTQTGLTTHAAYEFTAAKDGYKNTTVIEAIPMGSTEFGVVITLEKSTDYLLWGGVLAVIILVLVGVFVVLQKKGARRVKHSQKRTNL